MAEKSTGKPASGSSTARTAAVKAVRSAAVMSRTSWRTRALADVHLRRPSPSRQAEARRVADGVGVFRGVRVGARVGARVGVRVDARVAARVRAGDGAGVRARVGGGVGGGVSMRLGALVAPCRGAGVGSRVDAGVDVLVGRRVDAGVGARVCRWDGSGDRVRSADDSRGACRDDGPVDDTSNGRDRG